MTTKKVKKTAIKKVKKTEEPQQVQIMLGTNQFERPIARTQKKVAIVGFAPSSMRDVAIHFGDPEWEIWPLNQLYMAFPEILPHTTRWFQIHPRHHYDSATRDHSHHKWMAAQRGFPIYMQERIAEIPMSVEYPKYMISDHFRRYFTNSISWMLATAIFETLEAWQYGIDGFEEIALFGVDMAMGGAGSEYSFERPSVEYFCGIVDGMNKARAASGLKGVNLIIPQKSDICKTLFLYPFEETAPFREKLMARKTELKQRLDQFSAQEQQGRDARMQMLGCLENQNYILQAWENSVPTFEGPYPEDKK